VATIYLPAGRRVEFADEKAAFFFVSNVSSIGDNSYDARAASATNPKNSFVSADLTSINTTMTMRTSHKHWTQFTTGNSLPWLRRIPLDWDLVGMSPAEWQNEGCQSAMDAAVRQMNGPFRRAAGVTKLLHLKRPRLFPICDSYVMAMMGRTAWDARTTNLLIADIRDVVYANADALDAISAQLSNIGISRTKARIFDAILWFDAPSASTGPYSAFQAWLVDHHGGSLFF
jgi:hypothetical protein